MRTEALRKGVIRVYLLLLGNLPDCMFPWGMILSYHDL